jgi:predicted transcriptional regulator
MEKDRSGRVLLKSHSSAKSSTVESNTIEELNTQRPLRLGPLEASVMESLWKTGEGNVSDVLNRLGRQQAYTTVMTTLARLHKKGLLVRRQIRRTFFYSSAVTREDWHRIQTAHFLATFQFTDCLICCLVHAIGQYDEALLDELEEKIKLKRATL